MLEEGMVHTIGMFAITVLFIIFVGRLLGFQNKIIEGLGTKGKSKSESESQNKTESEIHTALQRCLGTTNSRMSIKAGDKLQQDVLDKLQQRTRQEMLIELCTGDWEGGTAGVAGSCVWRKDKTTRERIKFINELKQFHDAIDAAWDHHDTWMD